MAPTEQIRLCVGALELPRLLFDGTSYIGSLKEFVKHFFCVWLKRGLK